ncbi:MAG TPA: NAD(P)H-hydrate dehydratase [Bacteroidales bacterium]|nr:NAD(P)H-hydrate dehydratase [Bacteroidales bacterium]
MVKIFSTEQVRQADAYTIANEPIASIDLMERAAIACYNIIKPKVSGNFKRVVIFCGPGNNGGDGLAIGRMLWRDGIDVVAVIDEEAAKSPDYMVNLERYIAGGGITATVSDVPLIEADDLVIDAIFGSGLSKPIQGKWADVIALINDCRTIVVSVDIPSGLFSGKPSDPKAGAIVKADHTLSLQFPKLAFMFPENDEFTGDWQTVDIGLHQKFISAEPADNFYIGMEDAAEMLKPRKKFSHKGTYGHALLVTGSLGKMGAAVLSSRACLRSGTGLVTSHIPGCGVSIMQTAVPEAMVSVDTWDDAFTTLPHLDGYTALGAGPGIGTADSTQRALKLLLQESHVPLILDADALNILSENKTWLGFLPHETILTPHPKEFERLAGKIVNSFDRFDLLRRFAVKYGCYIVLKSAHTVTCTPAGKCYFNSTGNPGMATGGSGDVLTGIITGLAAQGYTTLQSCLLGVYLHGLAGDLAAAKSGPEALLASDIIDKLSDAWLKIHEAKAKL